MKKGKLIAGAVMVGTITLLSGCDMILPSDSYQGTMYTQNRDIVSVYREAWTGRDYYYDKGSKVYVNETGSTRTGDRRTNW